jgi:hypothetical protein
MQTDLGLWRGRWRHGFGGEVHGFFLRVPMWGDKYRGSLLTAVHHHTSFCLLHAQVQRFHLLTSALNLDLG